MKHTPQKKSIVEICFFALLYFSFLLPLVFYLEIWNPFESSKAFFFLFTMELILPFFLILLIQRPQLRPSHKNIFLIIFISFLVFETIAALIGVDPINSFFGNATRLDGLILWWHLLLFYLYLDCAFRLRATAKTTILNLFLIIAGIAALIGCLQAIHFIPNYSQQFGNRIASVLGNPIAFGGFLLIPFFLALDRLRFATKSEWKCTYGAIALLCLIGITVSQTRGAFIGLFLGGIIYGFTLLTTLTSKKRLFTTLFLFTFVIGSTALFFFIREQGSTTQSLYRLTHFQDESVDTRLTFWKYAMRGFIENPWFGVGHQNFFHVGNKYYTVNAFKNQDTLWLDKPHNMFLEVLVTGGIFTFLAYVSLFGFSIWTVWKFSETKSFLSAPALTAALIAYVAQNIFTFDLIATLFGIIVLFAFMNIHPKNNVLEKPLSFHFFWWSAAFIPLLGWFLFLSPFIKQMHFSYIGKINIQTNLMRSVEALEQSSNLPIIFDSILLTEEFKNLLLIAINSKNIPHEMIERIYAKASFVSAEAIKQHSSNAFLFVKSPEISYLYAVATKTTVPQDAIVTAKRAHELAPGRIEPLLALANIFRVNNDLPLAKEFASNAVQLQPTQGVYLWSLAIFYAFSSDWKTAAPLGIQALHTNALSLKSATELEWLFQYYKSKQDSESIKNLMYLHEQAVDIEPDNLPLQIKLAEAYAKNGEKEKAIETANILLKRAPESKTQIDAFIKLLQE